MEDKLLKIETDCLMFELTKNSLTLKLRSEVIESLKEMTEKDEVKHKAILNLLRWTHQLSIPLSDFTDVSMETIPTPPGDTELVKLIINTESYGGVWTHEIFLSPSDAKKLFNALKKLVGHQF